jgi:hypothetical protein
MAEFHRIAPAHPVPENKHVGAVDPEFRDLLGVSRDRDEVPRNRLLILQRVEHPLARRVGVGHGLERGESLRADDEQRLVGAQVARRLGEIRTIHIGDETKGHVSLAVILQCLVGHRRPEVRAADADVDDISNALPGMALPYSAVDAFGKLRHLVKHGVNLGNDIHAINEDLRAFWSAQCHMQNGAPLSDVDLFAPNVASMHWRRPDCSASSMSRRIVSLVIRFFE